MSILRGWPGNVVRVAAARVERAISDHLVHAFKIGRTVNPEGRAGDHGCDCLQLIYVSDSVDHAIQVEDALINYFALNPKSRNVALHGGGGVSDIYANYVYVALWERQRRSRGYY